MSVTKKPQTVKIGDKSWTVGPRSIGRVVALLDEVAAPAPAPASTPAPAQEPATETEDKHDVPKKQDVAAKSKHNAR
ncbi:MAG: hypothetical protein PHG96_10375 [Kiritimatiellae bacterium]|jgi:hypothetical protein|nr:hypothetical protein [Dehalococcoidia bacterium]MDD3545746.1 hypothetical protein [Kiritimatiellia bacterium]